MDVATVVLGVVLVTVGTGGVTETMLVLMVLIRVGCWDDVEKTLTAAELEDGLAVDVEGRVGVLVALPVEEAEGRIAATELVETRDGLVWDKDEDTCGLVDDTEEVGGVLDADEGLLLGADGRSDTDMLDADGVSDDEVWGTVEDEETLTGIEVSEAGWDDGVTGIVASSDGDVPGPDERLVGGDEGGWVPCTDEDEDEEVLTGPVVRPLLVEETEVEGGRVPRADVVFPDTVELVDADTEGVSAETETEGVLPGEDGWVPGTDEEPFSGPEVGPLLVEDDDEVEDESVPEEAVVALDAKGVATGEDGLPDKGVCAVIDGTSEDPDPDDSSVANTVVDICWLERVPAVVEGDVVKL